MQERNVLAGATATVISPLVDFYGKLLPFLLLAILLIAILIMTSRQWDGLWQKSIVIL